MSCPILNDLIRHCTALPSGVRLIALQFASYANEPTDEVWPGNQTVATALGVSKRHVRRSVSRLEQLGIMEAVSERTGGRNLTTRWRFNRSAIRRAGACGKPVENLCKTPDEKEDRKGPKGGHSGSKRVTSSAPDSSKIPPIRRSLRDLHMLPLSRKAVENSDTTTKKRPPTTLFRRLVGVVWAVMRQHPPEERWSEAKARAAEQGLAYWQPSPSGGILLDAAFRMIEHRMKGRRTA